MTREEDLVEQILAIEYSSQRALRKARSLEAEIEAHVMRERNKRLQPLIDEYKQIRQTLEGATS